MRTTPQENERLGDEIAQKVSAARGPAAVLFPLRGVSAIDCAGQPFDDPAARQSLLTSLRDNLGDVPLVELDLHINDAAFAEAAAAKLLELIAARKSTVTG
jgi:uncharacterized protein (UPF0261 family)